MNITFLVKTNEPATIKLNVFDIKNNTEKNNVWYTIW